MPDTAMQPVPDDLAALCSALVDGTLSDDTQRELEQLLRADRHARDAFRRFMEMESILAWELVTPGRHAEGDDGAAGRVGIPTAASTWNRAAAWFSPWLIVGAGLVGVAVYVALWPIAPPATDAAPGTAAKAAAGHRAWLVDTTNAVWADGVPRRPGEVLEDGPRRLEAGAAQVRFESGAVVTLNAPSEIEVLGDNRLFLRSGKIMPYVPPAAKGFTVVSPTGEVIDLGTEFSVSVDPQGRTDVFVVDGEVDVARGHGDHEHLVRATQGFGTRLDATGPRPEITDRPLVIDDFSGATRILRWRDVDGSRAAVVASGELKIPMEFRPEAVDERGCTLIVLDHDFSSMLGRVTRISFKATLPDAGLVSPNRWLACVIDEGRAAPPMAYATTASLGVLVSPNFQAGVRVGGEDKWQARVFARSEDAVGPYQVLITIDDTPAAQARHGSAVATVTVNGQEIVRQQPIQLGERPRIGLQTFVTNAGGSGRAIVDDFSISVSEDRIADVTGGEATGGEKDAAG